MKGGGKQTSYRNGREMRYGEGKRNEEEEEQNEIREMKEGGKDSVRASKQWQIYDLVRSKRREREERRR